MVATVPDWRAGSWSIRAWLVVLVLASIAPLAGYGLVHVVTSYLAQRASLIESAESAAREIASAATHELDLTIMHLQRLATAPTLQDGDAAGFPPLANDFLESVIPGATLWLFDAEGRQIAASSEDLAPRGHREVSEQILASGVPVVSDLDPGPARDLKLVIDVPVIRGRQVVADLSLGLPLAMMQAIVARQRLPRGWSRVIVDSAGRKVAQFPPSSSAPGSSVGSDVLRLLASGAAEGTADIRLQDGTLAMAALARTPRFGWSAGVAIPRTQIFAPLRSTVEELLEVGAAALALSLCIAVIIARRLARRVTSLARLAVSLDGDDVVMAHQTGVLEVDAVARVLQESVRRRRLAEETADDAELRAARLIEAVPCGVIVFDRDGRWEFVNRTMCDLLARSAAELLSLTVASPQLDVRSVDGTPIPPEQRASARALRGETVRDLEVTMRRGTGGRISLLLSSAPLRDRDGRIIGSLTAMLDVTERRAAQDRLDNVLQTLEARVRDEVAARETAQQEAAQAQKMQALGELAGGVAHDFNNVLQAISGAVALIERRADTAGDVRRFARTAGTAAERGAAVARRLLTFARRGDLLAIPIEVSGLLRETAELLRHTLGTQIEVRTEAASGAGWMLADPAQLQTVLLNLATNARDAMPQGGTLTLRAAPETIGATTPNPAGLRPGRYIRLETIDTGVGMDADTVARATEPFFTTKAMDKGTGLGLAMARGFAEQLGGGLWIGSIPSQGTTVRLWLAEASGPARVAVADPAQSHSPSGQPARGLNILLVDDEEAGRSLMAEELMERGFVVHQARDAAEARTLFETEPCDVLVTDFSMPGENGATLIAAVRAVRPGLPAVLLTGLGADPSLLEDIADAPAVTQTVGKPVRVSELARRITQLASIGA